MNSNINDISADMAVTTSLDTEVILNDNSEQELRVETRNIIEDTPMQPVDSHTSEQTSQHRDRYFPVQYYSIDPELIYVDPKHLDSRRTNSKPNSSRLWCIEIFDISAHL